MGREPGLKRFKISPSNDRFLIAETSSEIITIRTKKKKETFQRIGDLKNLTMEKGVRKTEKKKERKKEEISMEQRFGRRSIGDEFRFLEKSRLEYGGG